MLGGRSHMSLRPANKCDFWDLPCYVKKYHVLIYGSSNFPGLSSGTIPESTHMFSASYLLHCALRPPINELCIPQAVSGALRTGVCGPPQPPGYPLRETAVTPSQLAQVRTTLRRRPPSFGNGQLPSDRRVSSAGILHLLTHSTGDTWVKELGRADKEQ